MPTELKNFYSSNNIKFAQFNQLQKNSIKSWGINELQILDEMDRQELDLSQMNSSSPVATLLFAQKWFNSEITNKGGKSDLVKGLLLSPEELPKQQAKQVKLKNENEILTLCYLSYLETNNYLKTD